MKIPGLVLSMCVAACGGGGGDGGADGVDGGDGPGALTEVVALDDRSWGDPTPGLTVVFTEEGWTQTAVTDDAGRAAVALRGPATVTVIRPPDGPGFPLTSVVGVLPGERVVFGLADRFDPVRASMEVEVPPFEGGLGPYEYRVYTSCSSGAARGATGTRQTVAIDRPCDGDRVDVHVEAIFERQLQASLTVTGQPVVDGGLLTLDAPWMIAVDLEVLFTDRPVDASMYPDVYAYYRGRRVTASVHPGYCLERTPTCIFRPWVAGDADRVGIEAMIQSPDGSGDTQQLRTMIALGEGTKHTVPIRLLPWITEGQFDPASGRATWRVGSGDRADAATLLVGNDEVAWLLIAPPDVQELQLPDLSGLAGVSPPDLTGAGGAVLLFDRDDTDGYAEFRARGEALSFATFNDDVGARSSGGSVVAVP